MHGAEAIGGENLYHKPRRARCDFSIGALLPRPRQLAAFVDGMGKDLPPGKELVARFRPLLEESIDSGLSSKTVQKHVNNLWALGGEIIRDLNEDPSLRRKSMDQILDTRIDDESGPLVYAMEPEEPLQRSFDSTCRKLHRYLRQSSRGTQNSPTDSPTRLQSLPYARPS